MTITSSTDAQVNASVRNQSQTAEAKSNQKASAETKPSATSETPAVVVETTSQAPASASVTPSAELETAEDALNAAQAFSAAFAGQNSSIANASTGAVAGLLSEFEAAAA